MSQNSPKQWFNLEERFFKEMDSKLLAQLRSELTSEKSAKEIMQLTGINDEKLATEIAAMNVTVETLAAFRLVPLVAVAWADDRVEENERYAIKLTAEKAGVAKDSAAMAMLQSWTTRRPPADLLDAWCDYAQALTASLAGEHAQTLRHEVMLQVKNVAQAAGGVLGFGSISNTEQAVIDRVEQALS